MLAGVSVINMQAEQWRVDRTDEGRGVHSKNKYTSIYIKKS